MYVNFFTTSVTELINIWKRKKPEKQRLIKMNLSIFLSRVLIGVCRRLFPRNLTYSSNCTGSRFTRTMVGVLGPFCRVALNGKKNLPPETSTACRRHQALLPILRRSRRQKTRVRRRQRVKNVSLARTALAETIL